MPSLDNLPGDQRAVLEMVLERGRSYDEIARLLSLDRAAVRERAQIALDTIGPHTEVAPEHQHRIADYLLGQLPDGEAAEVRDLLADSPSDRAWARVVASELAPLAGGKPLPEIPVERSARRASPTRRPARRDANRPVGPTAGADGGRSPLSPAEPGRRGTRRTRDDGRAGRARAAPGSAAHWSSSWLSSPWPRSCSSSCAVGLQEAPHLGHERRDPGGERLVDPDRLDADRVDPHHRHHGVSSARWWRRST